MSSIETREEFHFLFSLSNTIGDRLRTGEI